MLGAVLLLGLSGLGSVAIGLFRTKLLSSLIGPGGIGTFGTLSNMLSLLLVLASLGLSTGMVRYLADARGAGDTTRMNLALSGAFWAQAALTVTVVIALVAFPKTLTTWLVGEQTLALPMVALALAVPLGVASTFAGSVLQGVSALPRMAGQSLAGTAAGVLVTAALVWGWGIDGAIWSIPAANAAAFVVAVPFSWRVWREERLRLLPRVDGRLLWDTFLLGFAVFASGILFYAVMQVLRSRVLLLHGDAAAGFFHGGLTLVGYFYVLAQALTMYLLPRMSEGLDDATLAREANQAWRLGTLAVTVLGPALVLFAGDAVRILLARDFHPVTRFLPVLTAVELVRIGAVVFGSTIIARGHRLAYVLANLGFAVPALAGGLALIGPWGAEGAVAAYAAGWTVNAVAVTFTMWRCERVTLWGANMWLLAKGLLLIAAAGFARDLALPWRLLILVPIAALAAYSIEPHEYRAVKDAVARRLGSRVNTPAGGAS